MNRYLVSLILVALILGVAPMVANAADVATQSTPPAQQLAVDPYSSSILVTSMFPVKECPIIDHGGCDAPIQAGTDCSGEGFPLGLCHCVVTPTRLCVETP